MNIHGVFLQKVKHSCIVRHGPKVFVAFSCWQCCLTHPVMQIFTLFLIHAYSTRVWKQQKAADHGSVSIAAIEHGFQSPEGHSKLVMDGPWTLLWPCFLIWPFFQAVASYAWIVNATGVHNSRLHLIVGAATQTQLSLAEPVSCMSTAQN